MKVLKYNKNVVNEGIAEYPIAVEDSVDVNMIISDATGEIFLLYRHVYILNARYVPDLFIIIAKTMCLSEESEFEISNKNLVDYFGPWLGIKSEADIVLKLTINKIYKPIDIMQDRCFIWRVFSSSQGRTLPHKKAKYKISASIEQQGKILAAFKDRTVRTDELPYILEESLKNMCENDSVIIECDLDSTNSIYLGGKGSEFDIQNYCETGSAIIRITLHQFIIGKSVIKSVRRYLNEKNTQAQLKFTNFEFEQAEETYSEIIQYIYDLNDSAFDDIKSTAMRNFSLTSLRAGNFERAEEMCSSILHVDPENAGSFVRRAAARVGAGRIEDAKEDLRKAKDLAKAKGLDKILKLVDQETVKIDILRGRDNYWSVG